MLQWLKDILGDAHTDETDKAVSEYVGKNFVSRSDFNTKNDEVKRLNGIVEERDKQLDELKKASADAGDLKKQIEGLQEANKTAKETHEKELAALRFDHALDAALAGAKVRDAISVKAHLKKDDMKLSDDGTSIIGLEDQIKALKESKDFLFESDKPAPHFGGPTPGVPADSMDAIRIAAGLPVNTK